MENCDLMGYGSARWSIFQCFGGKLFLIFRVEMEFKFEAEGSTFLLSFGQGLLQYTSQ
jgi:hypothetical protein